eukprot:Blabericola_migrator_1__3354@NODE_1991_length_3450_cov_60_208099_g1268_i0_p1_GENE_NODE_1991_length_3450_cov_60_208099_g1268_i0NODE_1991_length_3450_cov_60_208099_g1268_i0_p1_ORF_typecomplete_len406_score85_34PNK3P/PF08645_11/2_5e35AAA_33/PF13671_6/4_8e16tRNA_lig_kinase/PF08303_11/7_1e08Zeta_toxin/PF06414_12/4_4e05AAA/PF00004_29/0_00078RuvB_N/PF05496_12/0_0014AAA_17/PF13207_6/0_033Rad17/PF03215_15/0_031AAA_5/PF07728_14/0_07AAA_16/PF13191_6/0_066IstB_IS21/PF01695_17/1_4e03IstB_IS21/PF01695_17/0_59
MKQSTLKVAGAGAAPKVKVEWRVEGSDKSVLIGVAKSITKNEDLSPKAPITAFDLDGTLITPKSKRKWPIDFRDWMWIYGQNGSVSKPAIRKEYFERRRSIYIISNQKFTNAKGTIDQHIAQLKLKLDLILNDLEVPLIVLCALRDDINRKPRAGLVKYMPASAAASTNLYVGDAAGRPKDHAAGDYQWALNVGWEFQTPETFFLKRKPDLPASFPFDLRPLRASSLPTLAELLTTKVDFTTPSLYIMVGPPGCGKSYCARAVFQGRGVEWLNQDVMKDKNKLMKLADARLTEGRSVIIDRQNGNVAQRQPFIDVAKGNSIVAIFLDVPLAYAKHGNTFRMLCKSQAEHRNELVPPMVMNMYYKSLQEPTADEGFTQIHKISFGAFKPGPFEQEEAKELFHQFLS